MGINVGETLMGLVTTSGIYQYLTNPLALIMVAIACVLLYLAIVKQFEPLLLLPIAFGMLLTNLLGSDIFHEELFAGGHANWALFGGAVLIDGKDFVDSVGYMVNAAGQILTSNNVVLGHFVNAVTIDDPTKLVPFADILAQFAANGNAASIILEDAFLKNGAVYTATGAMLATAGKTISAGLLDYLYLGVKLGIYPCLIFMGVGAGTDFGPLISNPKTLLLGAAAMAAQYGLAGAAARWWLGDVRAAGALRVSAFGMPWMALSAVLRGFFIARRRVEPNVLSQLVEQSVRIGIIWYALEWGSAQDVSARCTAVLAATAVSEAVSACILLLFYRGEAVRAFGAEKARRPADPARRLWEILWPVEGGRCLASALHTAENMLVPACLTVCLLDAGGRSAAVAQYGSLKGMALPLLTFPFGLLGSLSVLLMPEITQAHIRGERARLDCLLDRMLRLTGCFSALAGALFWVWGEPLALLLYHSQEAGFYLRVLGPAMPLMYLESMVDGAMKGMGEQKAVFRYSLWDAVLRIAGVLLLLPRWGMKGFLWVILLSSAYTCQMNTARLLHVSGLQPRLWRWMGAPALAALVSAGAGEGLRALLAGWLGGGSTPTRLAALCAGGFGMAAVCLAVQWPLGLGEEVRAILRTEKSRRERQKSPENRNCSGHRGEN